MLYWFKFFVFKVVSVFFIVFNVVFNCLYVIINGGWNCNIFLVIVIIIMLCLK